MRIKLFQSKL